MNEQTTHHIGTLSPEMALLGMLYQTPDHGYDLHRKVVTDLGQVWHLSQSQAYAILKRMEARGDISVEQVSQEKLPSRQLLQITQQGRLHFQEWLEASSGGSTRAIRMEFLTRLYFLHIYTPEKIPQAFERQQQDTQFHIHRLEGMINNLPADQIFNRASLDLRVRQLKLVIDWLGELQAAFNNDTRPGE